MYSRRVATVILAALSGRARFCGRGVLRSEFPHPPQWTGEQRYTITLAPSGLERSPLQSHDLSVPG
jgi:hypothetical protein